MKRWEQKAMDGKDQLYLGRIVPLWAGVVVGKRREQSQTLELLAQIVTC